MSEEWISNSGEIEATMAGIYEEDPELDDEDCAEWLACEDGND